MTEPKGPKVIGADKPLPPSVRAAAQRILDREARRLLAEDLAAAEKR